MRRPIILALDTQDLTIAERWIDCTKDSIDVYKVGLEFFLKFGSDGINQLRRNREFDLFLDLKLHDIPNTVAAAVSSVAHTSPRFLTVHASGGSAMVKAAADIDPTISITAVTILTSLSDENIADIGYRDGCGESALRLGKLATHNGATSLVSSPFEASEMRKAVGEKITLITPGVRPAGSDQGDQSRIMTPVQAISAGADYLVIGRPITGFWSTSAGAMNQAAAEILESVQ